MVGPVVALGTVSRLIVVVALAISVSGCWGASNDPRDSRVALRGRDPDGSDLEFIVHLCPGETLADVELFYLGDNILSRVDDIPFGLPPGGMKSDTWQATVPPPVSLSSRWGYQLIASIRSAEGQSLDLQVTSSPSADVGKIISGGESFEFDDTAGFLATAAKFCR